MGRWRATIWPFPFIRNLLDHDREDIRSLVEADYVDRAELEQWARQALVATIGSPQTVEWGLQETLNMFEAPSGKLHKGPR